MDKDTTKPEESLWFAIKTRQAFRAEEVLAADCEEVFFPVETIVRPDDRKLRRRAVIPHVLFVKTTRDNILALETMGREHPELNIPFWIYRYPNDNTIQIIPQPSIDLLRLLTTDNTSGCEIYNSAVFKETERVRVTGGIYQGYEGIVKRIAKNKHVLVSIEGICMVVLPFIHPDLLEHID